MDEAVDETSAISIAGLVRRLDGLPLALELAAARLPLYSPQAIARHLDADPGGFLEQPVAGRHASLRAVLDWSVQLLSNAERRTLLDLSVIPSTFDLELASAVAARDDTARVLGRLAQHSLLAGRRGADGEPRFAMPETIRLVCVSQLEPDAHALAMSRLARAAAALVDRFGTRDLVTVTSDIGALAPVADVIRAALDWTADQDVEAALAIATG